MKSVGKKGGKRGEMELRPITMKMACPGIRGKPCAHKSYLKSNSSGDLCSYCREGILTAFQLIPANRAKAAIFRLAKAGIGSRMIADLAGMSRTTIQLIRNGKRQLIDPDTEAALLDLAQNDTIEQRADCLDCGLSHLKADRMKRLARMLPATIKEIQDAYPCTYPDLQYSGIYENRMVFRDLHSLGATRVEGLWSIEREYHEVLHRS